MNPSSRMHPLMITGCVVAGALAGFFTQVWRSGQGHPPFAPPYSLPATLAVISVVLVVLAVKLSRAVNAEKSEPVNPFHAVRLLAGARAAQLTGALFASFSLGLLAQLMQRTVPAGTHVWLPIAVSLLSGVLLLACGIYAERACRVPPEDGEAETAGGPTKPDATPDGLAANHASND